MEGVIVAERANKKAPQPIKLLWNEHNCGQLHLAASQRGPQTLPGYPGQQRGLALYFAVRGQPVTGFVFPISEEQLILDFGCGVVWNVSTKELSPDDALWAWTGSWKEHTRRRDALRPEEGLNLAGEYHFTQEAGTGRRWIGELRVSSKSSGHYINELFEVNFRSDSDWGLINGEFHVDLRGTSALISAQLNSHETTRGNFTARFGAPHRKDVAAVDASFSDFQLNLFGNPLTQLLVAEFIRRALWDCIRRAVWADSEQFRIWFGEVTYNPTKVNRDYYANLALDSPRVILGKSLAHWPTYNDPKLRVTFEKNLSAETAARFVSALNALIQKETGQPLTLRTDREDKRGAT